MAYMALKPYNILSADLPQRAAALRAAERRWRPGQRFCLQRVGSFLGNVARRLVAGGHSLLPTSVPDQRRDYRGDILGAKHVIERHLSDRILRHPRSFRFGWILRNCNTTPAFDVRKAR